MSQAELLAQLFQAEAAFCREDGCDGGLLRRGEVASREFQFQRTASEFTDGAQVAIEILGEGGQVWLGHVPRVQTVRSV